MTKLFSVETWVTQYFGYTKYAKTHYKTKYHEGLDVVPVDRTEWDVFAPVSGVVKWAGWGNAYGNNIILFDEHHGMSYRFCHLADMVVDAGYKIKVGTKIGTGGNTGKSGGRHLHINAVPMYAYGQKDFMDNGFNGRVDPLGVLRALGVWI